MAVCLGNNAKGTLGQESKQKVLGEEYQNANSLPYIQLGNIKIKELVLTKQSICAIFMTKQVKCWGSNIFDVLGQKQDSLNIGDEFNEIKNLDFIDFSHL